MIQRIQSVYLLLVAILLVVALCLPVGQFIGPDGIAANVFKPLGVTLADGNFQSTWGLFGILLLSAIIALCTIFLFRNRMLQVRMTVFGSLFNGFYLIPKFAVLFGMPMDAIVAMGTKVNAAITDVWTLVAFAVVPFNLVKGVAVSALTFLLYKRIERVLFRKKQPVQAPQTSNP